MVIPMQNKDQKYIDFFESLNKQRRAVGAEPYTITQVRYTRQHYDEYTTPLPAQIGLYEYFIGAEVIGYSTQIGFPQDTILAGTFNFLGDSNE